MPDPLILSTGQVLRGRNATYRLLNALHAPTVYKAQVLESSIIRAELCVRLFVVTFNMAAHGSLVRWSKQQWSPPRKP